MNKKIVCILILISVLSISCNLKSESEKWAEKMRREYVPITEQDLCGSWVDNAGELTYEFTENNFHNRYNKGDLFFNGTYTLKDNTLSISNPSGKKSKMIVVVKNDENSTFLIDSKIGAVFMVDLIHKKRC